MKFLVPFVGFLAAANALSFSQLAFNEWESFKATHAKEYDTHEEEKFRMQVFMDNKNKIAQHNTEAAKGKHTFFMGMNQFGDMVLHEFNAMMNGFKHEEGLTREGSTFIAPENVKVPKSVDWRTKGYVTPVKDQGHCGSCWAFSATGSLEGQHFRKTGKLVSLSEQNLVDCSGDEDNLGCGGGNMDNAFQYVRINGGIDTEESYPYEAKNGPCEFHPNSVGATDSGSVDVPSYSEEQLELAVATVGPVSVAIDAHHHEFMFYSHGILNIANCSSDGLNHAVLAVGYGVEHGVPYWLVKNSWAKTWGDGGYVKMAKDKNNQCGIATMASYPVV